MPASSYDILFMFWYHITIWYHHLISSPSSFILAILRYPHHPRMSSSSSSDILIIIWHPHHLVSSSFDILTIVGYPHHRLISSRSSDILIILRYPHHPPISSPSSDILTILRYPHHLHLVWLTSTAVGLPLVSTRWKRRSTWRDSTASRDPSRSNPPPSRKTGDISIPATSIFSTPVIDIQQSPLIATSFLVDFWLK